MKKIDNLKFKYDISESNGFYVVYTFYQTDIVKIDADRSKAWLNTSGFNTVTTKKHINTILAENGFKAMVYQSKKVWYVSLDNGTDIKFKDGMIITK